jgi:hypothetical protein
MLGASRQAHAEPLGAEIALQPGIVTNAFTGSSVAPGVGARAGASVESFYFGVDVMYYAAFGSSSSSLPPGSGGPGGTFGGSPPATLSTSQLLAGADLGYDFKLVRVLTLRPLVGVGVDVVNESCTSASGGCGDTKSAYFYFEPGLAGLVALSPWLFAGADGGALVLPTNGTHVAASFHGQLGVRF